MTRYRQSNELEQELQLAYHRASYRGWFGPAVLVAMAVNLVLMITVATKSIWYMLAEYSELGQACWLLINAGFPFYLAGVMFLPFVYLKWRTKSQLR